MELMKTFSLERLNAILKALIKSIADVPTSGMLKEAEFTIGGTRLLTLFSNPFELVPAPGAGKILVPVRWLLYFTHGTGADFATNTVLRLQLSDIAYANASGILGTSAANAFTTMAASGSTVVNTGTGPFSQQGTALNLTVVTGNPTGGSADASLKVKVLYYEVDF